MGGTKNKEVGKGERWEDRSGDRLPEVWIPENNKNFEWNNLFGYDKESQSLKGTIFLDMIKIHSKQKRQQEEEVDQKMNLTEI